MGLIIFDGDDTLWDTSSIFYNAQLGALENINKLVGEFDPVEEFNTLRKFDDLLIQVNDKPEYDFTMLFLSLIKYYREKKEPESIISDSVKIMKNKRRHSDLIKAININKKFIVDLNKKPSLYQNSISTLKKSREKGHIIILISEGNPSRIRKILDHYKLEDLFDHIHMFRKNPESYIEIVSRYISKYSLKDNEIFVVGDLLDRDVYYGNMIPATTFYKPGGYKPNQKPKNNLEKPDYKIKDISEILSII
jgi:FMN phosphatase YigB (HAD superfamily)